jgi:2-methylcitrate dehydratase PrpD
MGVTEELATWAVKTRAEDLPAEVVHEAKRDIINVLGVALYSARDPSVSILLNMFEAEGGNPRASVWGTGFRTSLANAALVNGYLAHLEDYDDTHFPTVLHPTSPTLPAAFAIAEAEK